MSQRGRAIGRWGVVLGASVGLLGALGLDSAGDDGSPAARRAGTVRLAQQQAKPAPKKKGGASKKAADGKKADAPDGMMDAGMGDAAAKADGAMAKGSADAGAPSFKRDVAPILVANCVGCHSGTGPGLARGKLDMTSFTKLMAGGKRGADIVAGDPDASHLLLMIRGDEQPKMPPTNTQRSVSDAAAGKIEAWIKAGARLDAGLAATDSLDKYALSVADLRRDELGRMKPEERDKVAEAAGRERWKKATSTVPEVTSSPHFLGFGNLPGDRMAKLLKGLEPAYALTNRLVGAGRAPALDPAEKVSVYVFKDLNSFTEFVRSVEQQEVEAGEVARARLNVESPYVAVVDPVAGGEEAAPAASKKGGRSKAKRGDESFGPGRSTLGLVTEQLVVGAANRAGKPPRWVSLGLGAYASASVEGGSPYYRRLREGALSAAQVGWPTKATEALGGQAPAEEARAVGFALFEWIAANAPGGPMNAFTRVMLGGQEKLDEAIAGCFGINREQFLENSGTWVLERYGR